MEGAELTLGNPVSLCEHTCLLTGTLMVEKHIPPSLRWRGSVQGILWKFLQSKNWILHMHMSLPHRDFPSIMPPQSGLQSGDETQNDVSSYQVYEGARDPEVSYRLT